ncbi:cytidylyltransferase domain-containing protein [Patescibacteria group bacterium]
MILGIVPARSGSKSVKHKNIKLLAGKPLIYYSIKVGLDCKQIDKLVVSTDSQKYAKIARKYGAGVILRPKGLAEDDTPMIPVLQHAVKQIESKREKVEVVILLDPTSPLRTAEDVKKCLDKLKLPETDSVVTVCKVEHNPYYVMVEEENNYLKYSLFKPEKKIKRRQDAQSVYRVNAAVYAIKRDVLMKGQIFTKKTRMVKMPQKRSGHIDSQDDFKYVEYLFKEGL